MKILMLTLALSFVAVGCGKDNDSKGGSDNDDIFSNEAMTQAQTKNGQLYVQGGNQVYFRLDGRDYPVNLQQLFSGQDAQAYNMLLSMMASNQDLSMYGYSSTTSGGARRYNARMTFTMGYGGGYQQTQQYPYQQNNNNNQYANMVLIPTRILPRD